MKERTAKEHHLYILEPRIQSPLYKEGKGYWKYIPNGNAITFLTQYDYEASFGKLGSFMDRLLFRPLIGWGTALSFDVLKRWLEKGEAPNVQYFRFFIAWTITFLFSFVWIYHGLFPKLIHMHPDEISMVKSLLSVSNDQARWIVLMTGITEVLFGLCWLFLKNKGRLLVLQVLLLPLLTIAAIIAHPDSLMDPFNPLTFNVSLLFVSIVGILITKDVPTATTCKRKR